jgi:hypothetical protein
MLHPGSRFQMAGDLLETYLLWLIEAHAHASEAGRVRIRPRPRRMPRSVRAVSAAVTPGGRAIGRFAFTLWSRSVIASRPLSSGDYRPVRLIGLPAPSTQTGGLRAPAARCPAGVFEDRRAGSPDAPVQEIAARAGGFTRSGSAARPGGMALRALPGRLPCGAAGGRMRKHDLRVDGYRSAVQRWRAPRRIGTRTGGAAGRGLAGPAAPGGLGGVRRR